jgi:hypothetical protein
MPRRYAVPETRLPFVNAEIAQVGFQGRPALVSSVWCAAGGRLYFWDPDSGARAMRRLPDGISGAYMLRAGPDGGLYLGCGTGQLVRYDPSRDAFDTLVAGALDGICWGGAVAGKRVFWNASVRGASGAVGVYDIERGALTKLFSPVDDLRPNALYGHCAANAPDGRIVWVFNVPQARLIVIDPKDLTARTVAPAGLADCAWSSCAFLDDRRLALSALRAGRVSLVVLSYPDFTELHRAPMEIGGHHTFKGALRADGGLYYLGGQDLWRLDAATLRQERIVAGWTGGETATFGAWQGRQPCAITTPGTALRYDPASGRTDRLDLEPMGAMSTHALRAAPQAGLILGAPFINQRFWSVSLATGEGRDLGRAAPGGGQVNQILWDDATRRFLLTSYITTSITAYDPARPADWPENPRLLVSAHDRGQMRPMAFLHDGRCVWMATSPEYGTLGGALCRLDPQSGRFDVRAPVLPGLRPNALAADVARRRLFVSTDIYGDCNSAPPTEPQSLWLVFDLDSGEIVRRRPAPDGQAWTRVKVVLPDGRALFRGPTGPALWDCDSDAVVPLAEPDGLADAVTRAGDALIAASDEAVGLLTVEGVALRFRPRLAASRALFLHVAGGALYYGAGDAVFETPLTELGL